MTEEKKEEIKKPILETVQKPAESAVPSNQPKSEPVAPPSDKPKAEAKPVAAEPTTCASCNKSIKNKRWYYRNGKYYCSKRCWQTASKKEKAPEAQVTPQK